VQDPSGNRIAQWQEVSPRQGIVDLSFPLAAEPALGNYVIEVERKVQVFSVEEYVLPKFEVTIHLPDALLETDKKLPIKICGRYTYGKPVQGKVQASLCQSFNYVMYRLFEVPEREPCIVISGQTEKNGCFSTEAMLDVFKVAEYMDDLHLQVQASLVEDGTGLEQRNTRSCKILRDSLIITFENTNEIYKPGIPYTGTMVLKGADGAVVPGKELLLIVNHEGEEMTQTLLTDSLGRAFFELETSGWNGRVTLNVGVSALTPRLSLCCFLHCSFFSASKSFLQIHRVEKELPCEQPQQLLVDYIFTKEALKTQLASLDVVFLVLAKGNIASVLRKELPAEAGVRGSFSLELPISLELAPMAKVLGYVVLPSGEMVADSIKLNVAKCLPNKVKVTFSEDRALPGSEVQLQLEAVPGSLCAIRAVDRSVLLMKPEAELNKEAVYKLLPEFDYPGSIQDPPPCFPYPWIYFDIPYVPMLQRRSLRYSRRHLLPYPLPNIQMDTSKLFQNAALKLFTNAKTRDACKEPPAPPAMPGLPGPSANMQPTRARLGEDSVPVLMSPYIKVDAAPEESPVPRTYFPETWLWDLVPVGEEGSTEVTVTVPDTITEWKAGMFCTAPQGLGLASPTTLTAFKPFFVELALPYSVVRKEAFTLVATVFNYLRQCLKVSGAGEEALGLGVSGGASGAMAMVWQVRVTLEESSELKVSAIKDEEYGGCICADEAKTFRWGVRATSLGEVNVTVSTEALESKESCGNEVPVVPAQGRVDTVIKPLLVQPGGILVEKAHNSLLCQEAAEEISLDVPANILEGSQRAHVTVMGDIMGNALQNLDHLLAMPYGCGEQNMVHFAPNIYIQQYLEKSNQLRPDIRAKAQGFLQSGYQRELLYKHDDGSYSAFGKSDDSGNTWLTAFVLKSFGQARAYVAIDERHITDALRWLQEQQREDGCFRNVGKLFNNALQGGISNDLSLSAYVSAAMLELGLPATDPKVSLALQCLEASPTDDLYTQGLLAYVFGLAGRGDQQRARLQSLAQHSVSADGQLYWQRKVKAEPSSQIKWAEAMPAEVEMTSYVLLAYLTQPEVSSDDLQTASQIVRWLIRQQNPYGGFASTQDTVVALQALAKYAALTYSSNGDFTVTVTSPAGTKQDFVLQKSNRLVLQKAA
ncbi:A2ML1 protein, partial [Centropus bengalensis]|nr:A2ML1 protein [Centropus bengalensis]